MARQAGARQAGARQAGARRAATPPEAAPAADPAPAPRHGPERGLRETLREIGIVTVGVMIAVAVGQVVDAIHWAGEVKAARGQLAREMAHTNLNLAYRVAARPCIDRRLDALEDVVEQVAKGRPTTRLGPVTIEMGNAYNTNVWEIHRASQTLSHFGDRELAVFSNYYRQIDNIRPMILAESMTWQTLNVLQGDPSRLGPADIAGLRVAIQDARFDNYLIAGIAADELDYAKSLHQPLPAADAERLKASCGPLPIAPDTPL
ncbi:MAG: hypothetical protein JWP35_2201 [Caulobacter sp.]|nr:hypothetical protein [Caulobacter sp.]